jgi:hypothetical protein
MHLIHEPLTRHNRVTGMGDSLLVPHPHDQTRKQEGHETFSATLKDQTEHHIKHQHGKHRIDYPPKIVDIGFFGFRAKIRVCLIDHQVNYTPVNGESIATGAPPAGFWFGRTIKLSRNTLTHIGFLSSSSLFKAFNNHRPHGIPQIKIIKFLSATSQNTTTP